MILQIEAFANRSSWYNGVIREKGDEFSTYRSGREQVGRDVHQPHDKGYKSLLSSKKVFLELLRGFVKRDWVTAMDEDDLVKMDKSYVSAEFRRQESDLVYRARMRPRDQGGEVHAEEQDVLFYVLLEMQSDVDQLMPYRLLSYMTEIWRDVLKNAGKDAYKRNFALPVIIPIVLYNGKREWSTPLRFKEKLADADKLGEEVLDFPYLLIDVQRHDEEHLVRQGNLISSVFLLDQVEDVTHILERLTRLLRTLRSLSTVEWNLFWNWANHIMGRSLPEAERQEVERIIQQSNPEEADDMITNIEKVIMRARMQDRREGKLEGRLEGQLEGKLEGRLEGKIEGKLEIAARLLSIGMSVEQVAEVADLPIGEVRKLGLQ
jgi:predicted transposase YdaD